MSVGAGRQRVAVFAPSFPPGYLGGGPARTLEALVREAPESSAVFVIAPSRDTDGSELQVVPDQWTQIEKARVFYASAGRFGGIRAAYREVRQAKPTIIYLNSFFNLSYSVIPRLLGLLKYWGTAQILVAPRGEFDKGALNIRIRKKKTFIAFSRLIGLDSRAVWHASTPLEVSAITEIMGPRARVFTREDETGLPGTARPPELNSGQMNAAFLGRIAPKKGLLLALQALEDSSAHLSLAIYGPEEDRTYTELCKQTALRLPPNIDVQFKGSIPPDDVRETLAKHDIMLMPTSGENFGHVIAESLSVACPVMCTTLTPWTDLLREGGGVVVNSQEPSAWRHAIEDAAKATPEERLARRQIAARMYEKWRNESKGPHIFTLVANP